jgi:hypothetical protein
MKIYWIFFALAIFVALYSYKIDKVANTNYRLKKIIKIVIMLLTLVTLVISILFILDCM